MDDTKANELDKKQELFEAIEKQLRAQIKKKEKLLNNLRQDYQQFLHNSNKESEAELLKINFPIIKKGMSSVVVMDYFQDPPVTRVIDIDAKLSPQENLGQFFNRIKRSKRGLVQLAPRILDVEQALAALKTEFADFLSKGPDHLDVESPSLPKIHPKQSRHPRLPYRVFVSRENIPIWVGRSAKDNDQLLKFFARGNEWWLHAKETPGSHVIIKNSIDAIPLVSLLDAAHLAAHFCKIKEPNIEIIYTRVKYVRKLKGMPAGKVSVMQQKSLFIKKDPEILKQLLHSEIKHVD